MWFLLLAVLVGCGGAPFTLAEVTPQGDAGMAADDTGVPAEDSGVAISDSAADSMDARDDAIDAVADSATPALAPTDCPPEIQPPAIEVWTVFADGGFAPQPGGDCQGLQIPVGDTYSCASVERNWVCPWQSAGQPDILLWCHNPSEAGSPLVIVGCLQP